MTTKQKQALFANTDAAMVGVPEEIQRRWIGHCTKADPAYGEGVARVLGLVLNHAAESPAPLLPAGLGRFTV